MKRSDAIRQLGQELGYDQVADDLDRDEVPSTDEVPDISGYSLDMLTEECRRYGIIDESESVVDDED